MRIWVERVYNLGEYKSVRLGREDNLSDGTPEEVISKFRNLQLLYVDMSYDIYRAQLANLAERPAEERYEYLLNEFEKTIAEIKALQKEG